MIKDYLKNSEDVLNNRHWTTCRHKFRECFSLMRYLMDMGYQQADIYKFCQSVDDSLDKTYLDSAWKMAQKITLVPYIEGISEKEYEYINNLPVARKYKEYLAFLCEFKRNNPRTFKNSKMPSLTYQWTEKQIQQGVEWNEQYHLFAFGFLNSGIYLTLDVYFLDKDATVFKTDYQFDEWVRICPVCGKSFIHNSRRHTDLCPDCYKALHSKDRHLARKKPSLE